MNESVVVMCELEGLLKIKKYEKELHNATKPLYSGSWGFVFKAVRQFLFCFRYLCQSGPAFIAIKQGVHKKSIGMGMWT
jgi:hypothetical protein